MSNIVRPPPVRRAFRHYTGIAILSMPSSAYRRGHGPRSRGDGDEQATRSTRVEEVRADRVINRKEHLHYMKQVRAEVIPTRTTASVRVPVDRRPS